MTGMAEFRKLVALPLTAERFAPFGDVLETAREHRQSMNSSRFERFANLADIDVGADSGGRPAISIARCKMATPLPYRLDMLERHPNGSQAFMPLGGFQFIVAVAPAGEGIEENEIQAFLTNGRQGINYHKGVWHMPMIGLQDDQEFLIVDRAGNGGNCDELFLDEPLMLEL